jgi:hypothetical protein
MHFRPLVISSLLLLGGCIHVKVDPVEVRATVDVNVKVDREVSNLLTDIYGDSKTVKAPAQK